MDALVRFGGREGRQGGGEDGGRRYRYSGLGRSLSLGLAVDPGVEGLQGMLGLVGEIKRKAELIFFCACLL